MTVISALLPAAAAAGHVTSGEAILFWVLGPVMVISSLGLLFARKAVHAALSLILVMVSLAFLYVAQGAVFLGIVQVVVYTGAIMMLFLFVLMLVGVDSSDSLAETLRGQRPVAVVAGLGLVVVLAGVVGRATYGPVAGLESANADTNPVALAELVFGKHAFALEIVGALLVTAALGALVLTHRERLTPKRDQRARADARVAALADGVVLTPLPAPGVYARHNAMDVPALGADGRPLEASVPRVIRVRGQEADAREYAARIDRVLAGGWADEAPPPAVDAPTETGQPQAVAAVPDAAQGGPAAAAEQSQEGER